MGRVQRFKSRRESLTRSDRIRSGQIESDLIGSLTPISCIKVRLPELCEGAQPEKNGLMGGV